VHPFLMISLPFIVWYSIVLVFIKLVLGIRQEMRNE
jgi:hypothetical protein